jgi:hypothetical protein
LFAFADIKQIQSNFVPRESKRRLQLMKPSMRVSIELCCARWQSSKRRRQRSSESSGRRQRANRCNEKRSENARDNHRALRAQPFFSKRCARRRHV